MDTLSSVAKFPLNLSVGFYLRAEAFPNTQNFCCMFTATAQPQDIPSLCISRHKEPNLLSDSQAVILGAESKFSEEIVRRLKHSFLLNGALQCCCNRKKSCRVQLGFFY